MTTKNDGGPAFPAMHYDLAPHEHGLSVRDYFAAKAMQGMLFDSNATNQSIAEFAYALADEMLRVRELK